MKCLINFLLIFMLVKLFTEALEGETLSRSKRVFKGFEPYGLFKEVVRLEKRNGENGKFFYFCNGVLVNSNYKVSKNDQKSNAHTDNLIFGNPVGKVYPDGDSNGKKRAQGPLVSKVYLGDNSSNKNRAQVPLVSKVYLGDDSSNKNRAQGPLVSKVYLGDNSISRNRAQGPSHTLQSNGKFQRSDAKRRPVAKRSNNFKGISPPTKPKRSKSYIKPMPDDDNMRNIEEPIKPIVKNPLNDDIVFSSHETSSDKEYIVTQPRSESSCRRGTTQISKNQRLDYSFTGRGNIYASDTKNKKVLIDLSPNHPCARDRRHLEKFPRKSNDDAERTKRAHFSAIYPTGKRFSSQESLQIKTIYSSDRDSLRDSSRRQDNLRVPEKHRRYLTTLNNPFKKVESELVSPRLVREACDKKNYNAKGLRSIRDSESFDRYRNPISPKIVMKSRDDQMYSSRRLHQDQIDGKSKNTPESKQLGRTIKRSKRDIEGTNFLDIEQDVDSFNPFLDEEISRRKRMEGDNTNQPGKSTKHKFTRFFGMKRKSKGSSSTLQDDDKPIKPYQFSGDLGFGEGKKALEKTEPSNEIEGASSPLEKSNKKSSEIRNGLSTGASYSHGANGRENNYFQSKGNIAREDENRRASAFQKSMLDFEKILSTSSNHVLTVSSCFDMRTWGDARIAKESLRVVHERISDTGERVEESYSVTEISVFRDPSGEFNTNIYVLKLHKYIRLPGLSLKYPIEESPEECYVVGWGLSSIGITPSKMFASETQLLSKESCEMELNKINEWPKNPFQMSWTKLPLPKSKICGKNVKKEGPSTSDRGAPLICYSKAGGMFVVGLLQAVETSRTFRIGVYQSVIEYFIHADAPSSAKVRKKRRANDRKEKKPKSKIVINTLHIL